MDRLQRSWSPIGLKKQEAVEMSGKKGLSKREKVLTLEILE